MIVPLLESFEVVRCNLRARLVGWGRRFGQILCTWVKITIFKVDCLHGLPGTRGVGPMPCL